MKKVFLIGLFCLTTSVTFAQSQDVIVTKRKIVNNSSGEVIARYELNETKDTLNVTLYREYNINSKIPEITYKINADPKTLKYIKETSTDGTVSHRLLAIVLPEQKERKSKKEKKPEKSPQRISVDYSLGRHTDQFSAKFRYLGSFGIEGSVATSLYRGDVKDNYLYLGLSQDFDDLYYTEWQGHFSLGPIAYAETGKNEIKPGLVVIGSFYRKIDRNFYFGPKIMLGSFNEFSFSISTRF